MRPRKKFSRFLLAILLLFESLSLSSIVGCLYILQARTMERDFRHKTELRQVETSIFLRNRIERLRGKLHDISTSNTIRVSLMLDVESQISEILNSRFGPSNGAYFFIREAGKSEFIPHLPEQFLAIKGDILAFKEISQQGPVKFQKTRSGHYMAIFSIPVKRRLETLGTAYLVYDLSSDQAFWSHMKLFPHASLLSLEGSHLVNLATGLKELVLEKPEAIEDCATINGKFIMPLKDFPGFFYCVSSEPLRHAKRNLMALLLVLCAGVFMLTVVLSFIITQKVSRPLEDISAQAVEVARNPSTVRIDDKGVGYLEFQDMVKAFNDLLAALMAAKEKLKEKAKEKLQESEDRYQKTFDASPLSITTLTLNDARFIEVNDAFCKLSGYSRREAIGRTVFDLNLFADPGEGKGYMKVLRLEGEVTNVELDFRVKDGRIVTGLVSARRLRYAGKDCMVVLVSDITQQKKAQKERKNLEAQLRQAQKMEAIGTLAGGVAHDFRNILQAIMGYSEIIMLSLKKGEKFWDEIIEIQRAAKRASELTQQLLTFSRKVESHLRPVDLNQEIRQAAKLLGRTIPKTINIELHLLEDLDKVNADPAQIEQVLLNLGINAKDAMPEGGRLIVETNNIILDKNYCNSHVGARPGKYVLLTVTDTGKGMDKETLDHIFEPFYTTKDTGKGTGLGLAMVYGIVKNHNGYITCYSEPGLGTSFKIYLPVFEYGEDLWDEVNEATKDMPMGSGETLLVIDDDESILTIAQRALHKFNYNVLTATDGNEALKIYKKAPRGIDLIILDYMMPGIDGMAVLDKIYEINPEAKVIMASGYPLPQDRGKRVNDRIRGFLKKPFSIEEMLTQVRAIIDAP